MALGRKKVLVEGFDEIQAGMLLVVEPCLSCAGSHEVMARRLGFGMVRRGADTEDTRTKCWLLFDDRWPCQQPDNKRVPAVSERSVAEKRVYRILDDGVDEYTKKAKAKKDRQLNALKRITT